MLDVIRKRAAKFGNRFIHVTEEHDTPLAGDFQRRNAALAVRAARELRHRRRRSDRAQACATRAGAGGSSTCACSGKDIWIDGGHNAHAVAATAPFFDANVPRPRLLVFGMMSDKDVDAGRRRGSSRSSIASSPPSRIRRAPCARTTFAARSPIPNPDDAFRAALDAPERAIVITGSLYLAGAAIAFFDKIPRP